MPHTLHTAHLSRRPLARVAWVHVAVARVVWVSLLVLALLWTQSLGLWHQQVHSGIGHTAARGLVHATAAHATYPVAPPGIVFSNHQSDTDCQLFDQLSHSDGVTALLVIAPALATVPQFLRASHGLAVARWHALFQARGPPSVR